MLQLLLSVISVVIAAVGIPMLYFQLRDMKTSIRSSAHAAIYSQAETLRGYLVEYPHLRKYFFEGEQIHPENKDYNRVVSIAEIYLNYLEHIAVLQDSFGKNNLPSLHRFAKISLEKSPILKQHFKTHALFYSDALHKMLDVEINDSAKRYETFQK